jgi:hypothetical protein
MSTHGTTTDGAPRQGASIATRAVVVLACSLMAVACTVGETTYETVVQPVRAVSAVKTCSGAFAKPDVSTLTVCGGGKGHCYDGAKTAITGLPDCPGGSDACIPDKVLASNGGKLKTCKFFVEDKPGVCMSTLLKDIALHQNELQRDVCDEDERCAPCIDPRNGNDTHICDPIGVYENKCKGGPGQQEQTCCHGEGVCINQDAAPADQRDSMVHDSCALPKVCAPAAMVDGNPTHCNVYGASGVCIDLCFSKMLMGAQKLLRAGCGPTAVCLPCFIGSGQGVPGCT